MGIDIIYFIFPSYRILFTHAIPHVAIKKTFIEFRIKIFDHHKECKLIRGDYTKTPESNLLKFLIETENSELLFLQIRLIIKKQNEIFAVIKETEKPVNNQKQPSK